MDSAEQHQDAAHAGKRRVAPPRVAATADGGIVASHSAAATASSAIGTDASPWPACAAGHPFERRLAFRSARRCLSTVRTRQIEFVGNAPCGEDGGPFAPVGAGAGSRRAHMTEPVLRQESRAGDLPCSLSRHGRTAARLRRTSRGVGRWRSRGVAGTRRWRSQLVLAYATPKSRPLTAPDRAPRRRNKSLCPESDACGQRWRW